jgi:hypothetical protein
MRRKPVSAEFPNPASPNEFRESEPIVLSPFKPADHGRQANALGRVGRGDKWRSQKPAK